MATISKFYLLDAVSPNTDTMPAVNPQTMASGGNNAGQATGASTARDATDVPGTSDPDIEVTITSNANTISQNWGFRTFVSRPLAAQDLHGLTASGWSFSYARQESNLNHNQSVQCFTWVWRPSGSVQVREGSTSATPSAVANSGISFTGTEPTSAGAVQAQSISGANSFGSTSFPILDGDVLVFSVFTGFTQVMGTSYTDSFEYDGTTEASITTCASFVSPPSPITLYTPPTATSDVPEAALDRRSTSRRRVVSRRP